jgi:hypothetical protein
VPTKPIPLLFKEGRLRLNKKIPFRSGADGVVSNFKENEVATRPFSNPVCAAKDASQHLLIAQTPLLKNGGEWGRNHT